MFDVLTKFSRADKCADDQGGSGECIRNVEETIPNHFLVGTAYPLPKGDKYISDIEHIIMFCLIEVDQHTEGGQPI